MIIKTKLVTSLFLSLLEKTRGFKLFCVYMLPILLSVFPIVKDISINSEPVGHVGIAVVGFMTGLVIEGVLLIATETAKALKK